MFTTKKNTICWVVVQFLDKKSAKKKDSFRNSAWGPEAAEAMFKQVRYFRLPGGKDGEAITMGDLIDRILKNSISKVTLEEKVFKSWYNRRAVLLGDGEDFFLLHVFVLPDGKSGAFADLYNSRLQIRTNSMSLGTL